MLLGYPLKLTGAPVLQQKVTLSIFSVFACLFPKVVFMQIPADHNRCNTCDVQKDVIIKHDAITILRNL